MILADKTFWAGVAERAVKTFAQALLAALAVTSTPLDVLHTNWVGVLSVAFGAAMLSALTSLASMNVGLAGTPAAEALRAPGGHGSTAAAPKTQPIRIPTEGRNMAEH